MAQTFAKDDNDSQDSSSTLEEEEEDEAPASPPLFGNFKDDDDGDDPEEAAANLNPEQEQLRRKMSFPQRLFQKFAEQPVKLRVHDVKIQGNSRTKDVVIEAQFDQVKNAEDSQELLREVALAINRMESLGIFEECVISLEPGPVELPGTANVVVNVKETKNSYGGDVGIYTKPETRSWTFDGSLKWKNLLGYAETWDGTVSYGYDGTTEMGAGLYYPRFKNYPVDFVTRASVFNQDWQKHTSYTERLVGLSAGFVTNMNHELNYNLTWRTLQDPSRMSSASVRRQLGHSLLSAIKYTYKVDNRDSGFRPTEGYAFRAATEVAGLGLDHRLVRFVKQELDFRFAIPLGFMNAALNLGISGGLILPWGQASGRATPISDRFFMGGNASLVCDMNGPTTMPGFHCRGIGPMDRRRARPSVSDDTESRDNLGGDLSVTGFADLSFDLPIKFLREHNIHAHCFVSAGNLLSLPEVKGMSLEKFQSSTRVSAGAGIVIPTKLFRLEMNYCEVLRQLDTDCGRRGLQFSFASPR